MKTLEKWVRVDDCEGVEVSNFGRVKRNNIILTPTISPEGYLRVSGAGKERYIHRLVAKAFLVKTDDRNIVNHIDGDKTNNNVTNLEWCTPKENSIAASLNNQLSRDTGRKGAVIVESPDGTQTFYRNQKECSVALGVDDSEVNKCIKGHRKKCHGYRIRMIGDRE